MSFTGRSVSERTDLFVGNIPLSWTEDALYRAFSEHCQVLHCKIVPPKDPSARVGFGFVGVPCREDAEKCIEKVHRKDRGGFSLRTEIAGKKGGDLNSSSTANMSAMRSSGLSVATSNVTDGNSPSSVHSSGGQKSSSSLHTPVGASSATHLSQSASLLLSQSDVACSLCGKTGKHRCKRCKVPYCSVECQKSDWTAHKLACQVLASHSSTPSSASSRHLASPALSSHATTSSSSPAASQNYNTADQPARNLHDFMRRNVPDFDVSLSSSNGLVENTGDTHHVSVHFPPSANARASTSAGASVGVDGSGGSARLLARAARVGSSELKAGQTVKVLGLGASHSSGLWVRLADDDKAAVYSELQQHLSQHACTASPQPLPTNQLVPDSVAMVQRDDRFCRGRLISSPIAGRLSVQLLDDGQTVMVNRNALYRLPVELHINNVPPLAFQLSLHAVRSIPDRLTKVFISLLNDLTRDHVLSASIVNVGSIDGGECGDVSAIVTDEKESLIVNDVINQTVSSHSTTPSRATPSPALSPHNQSHLSVHVPVTQSPLLSSNQQSGHIFNTPQSSIPGFSAARLRCVPVQTPLLMAMPNGFQSIQLPDGDSRVELSCIRDDSPDIYIHVCNQDQSDRLARLNAAIQSVHATSPPSNFHPALGQICLGRYGSDGQFYRCRVEGEESAKGFKVVFVDYGDISKLAVDDMRPLPPNLTTLPFQAVRCSLAGVLPSLDKWSEGARELMLRPHHLVANLVSRAQSGGDAHVILLRDRTTPSNESVLNDTLLEHGFAVKPSDVLPFTDSALPEVMVIESAAMETRQTYCVSIAYVASVGLFYLVRHDEESLRLFEAMNQRIQQHCQTAPVHFLDAEVGDLCLARFTDGLFYRAKVRKVAVDDCTLFFLDVGSLDDIGKADLRPMYAEFLDLPAQAIAACLNGIEPCSGAAAWSEAANQLFATLVDSDTFSCECVSKQAGQIADSQPLLEVNLYSDSATSPDEHRGSISAAMVAAGDARYKVGGNTGQSSKCSQVSLPSSEKTNRSPLSSSQSPISSSISQKPTHSTAPSSSAAAATASALSPAGEVMSSGNPTSSDLHVSSLPEELSFSVLVTEAADPSSVWLQPFADDTDKFVELNEKLRNHCQSLQVSTTFSAGLGDVCCARYHGDGNYYRVHIDKVLSQDRYQVSYIDFGNTATVSRSLLFPAMRGMLEFPVQAVHCQLAVDLASSGVHTWPEDVLLLTTECVNMPFEAVQPVDPSAFSGLPAIDLEDPESGISVCQRISQLLCNVAPTAPAASTRSPKLSPEVVSRSQQLPVEESKLSSQSRHPMIYAKDIVCTQLAVGTPTDCVLSEIKSPSKFWLTLASSFEHLSELLDSMADPADLLEPFHPCVGELCAVKYSVDTNWYRAQVNCVLDDVVEVTFVDFGNSETTTTSELRPLAAEHCKLPLQAVQCRLTGCQPIFGTKWPAEATAAFRDLVTDVEVSCTSSDVSDEGLCSVAIQLSGKDVASRLVRLGHAVFDEQPLETMPPRAQAMRAVPKPTPVPAAPITAAAAAAPITTATATTAAAVTAAAAAAEVVSSAATALGTDAAMDRPSVRLPPCGASGPSSKASSQPSSPLIRRSDEVKWSSLPAVDGDIDVIIADMGSPSCFYVQYVDSEAIKKLNNLLNAMNEAYSEADSTEASPLNSCQVQEHSVVAARFSEDACWYRAIVLQSTSSDMVQVRFTDFGNTDLVSRSLLRPLTSEMLQLPMQAIPCSLADVQPTSDSGWSQESVALLRQHVGEVGAGRVTVQRSTCQSAGLHEMPGSAGTVQLHVTSVVDGRSISDVLVTSHCAVPIVTSPAHASSFTLADLPAVKPSAEDGYFEGLISDAESPECFHLQLAKTEAAQQIQDLGQSLASFVKTSSPVKLCELSVNDLCLAQFSADRCWYRVVVCKINNDSAEVRFVDFGNTGTVGESNLRQFDERFLSLPRQAMMCKLHGIESSQSDGTWSTDACKVLQKFGSASLCVRLYGEVEDGVLDVDLFDTSGDADVNVGDEIVKAGGGLRSLPLVSQALGSGDQQLQRQQEKDGGEEFLGRAHRSSFPSCHLPTRGRFEVLVLDTRSPASFSVQAGSDDAIIASANLLSEMASTLESCDAMEDYCPILGEICCARFSEDLCWYRAVVDSVSADRHSVDVTFVDFGNSECNVEVTETRPLPEQFCSQPMLAVACSLSGLLPPSGESIWSPAAIEMMKSLTPMSVKLQAEVIPGNKDLLEICLFDSDGVRVADRLVEAGFAMES